MAHGSRQIDPAKEHLGRVYAQALLGAADGAGATATVLQELDEVVRHVIPAGAPFRDALQSPRVAVADKARMLDKTLGGRIHVITLNFLKVVARRGRMDCIDQMADAARTLDRRRHGIIEVTVVTARPLDADGRSAIVERLQEALGKQVVLHEATQPDLLGGVVFRVGDRVLDGSVVARLETMQRHVREETMSQIRESLERFTVEA